MNETSHPLPSPENPGEALAAVCTAQDDVAAAEIRKFKATLEYVSMNLVDPDSADVAIYFDAGSFGDQEMLLAGQGAPAVSEFAVAEYAAALGMSTEAGKRYVGALMEIRYRLPLLHALVVAGQVPVAGPPHRGAHPSVLDGGVLLLESSEELIPATEFGRIVRSLGERGLIGAVDAVVVARPPTSSFEVQPTVEERAARRAEQRDVAIETVQQYNPDAVIVVGVSFGHTRPQWILPYGGRVTADGTEQRLWADYS